LILRLKPEHDLRPDNPAVVAGWCYRGPQHYSPMILGMDYQFLDSHKIYKQAVYQVVLRGRELGARRIYLGFSADLEKRKVGAKQVAKVAFVQSKDNFNSEVIESYAIQTAKAAVA
jgi:hypothetical protein